MKKLMLFAAVAAIAGGAFAADPCVKCPWAYKIKVIVKTTTAKDVQKSSAAVCGCVRKPATRRYIGYFFGQTAASVDICGTGTCGCIDLTDPESFEGYLAMWNFDNGNCVTPQTADLRLLNRIGLEDTSTAEIVFDTKYTDPDIEGCAETSLAFAGFGKVAKRADGSPALKTASGFCAGTVPGVCYSCEEGICGETGPCTYTGAIVWRLCAPGANAAYAATTYLTAAYGKWSMAWDAEMVNRLTTGKTVLPGSDEEGAIEQPTGFTPAGFEEGTAAQLTAEGMAEAYEEYDPETDAE